MSELTSRQKQAITTREKIYRCAMELFGKYTYANVTVKDICKAAEVSIGGFYHYFNSKADILNDGYRLFDEAIRESMSEKRIESPVEKIYFLIREQCKATETMGVLAFAELYKNQLTSEDKYILNTERFFYHELKDAIAMAIEEGSFLGEAKQITTEVLSVVRGLIYDWILHEGNFDLTERALKMTKIILESYI